MREVVIVDGLRTAFGKLGGTIRDIPGTDLAALVLKALAEKTKVLEKTKVDNVFCGSALGDSQSSSPARFAALNADFPWETAGTYIEMQCGSAIASINHAAWKIQSGAADVIIAGGFESYSQMPAKFSMSQPPYKLIPPMPLRSMLAPTPEQNVSMITISDLMAEKWGITREECDKFACQSQARSAAAIEKGLIGPEIVPVPMPATKKTPAYGFVTDEQLRPETNMEGLAKLKPVNAGGVTTAGNASGRNDGAAFVLMMTAEKAAELGYEPYARFVCGADAGVEPRLMGIGAAYSSVAALKLAGLKLEDIDVFECNEAFAAQNLAVIKEMETQMGGKIDMEKWNPNGGAISFGHANGASGARICIFAMKQLEATKGKYGLFTSCCGGGMGVTTIIENLRK